MYYFFNHDEALLCWFKEKNRQKVDHFTLITIDHHIDMVLLDDEFKNMLKEFREDESIKNEIDKLFKLRDIIDKNPRKDNSSFIKAAIELEIIQDTVIISPGDLERISSYNNCNIYHPTDYLNSFLEILKSFQPTESDKYKDKDEIESKKIFNDHNYILDFDLDYFTYKHGNETFAVSESYYEKIFNNWIFDDLINNAKVITIALEPEYCGGILESIKIFYNLMKHIENKIRN